MAARSEQQHCRNEGYHMIFPFFIVGLLFTIIKKINGIFPFIFSVLGYSLLTFIVYCIIILIMAAVVDETKEQSRISKLYKYAMINSLKIGFKILNVKLTVTGQEMIPNEKFLLVQNHVTMFDPLSTFVALEDYDIGIISKPENKKLFAVGKFMHMILALTIDRENPRNAVKTINKASKLITDGICSIGIYPEGTRRKEEKVSLLPFKKGSLKIATKAICPIVVTTISGADQIKKNAPFRRTNIELKIMGVIPAETVKSSTTNDLSKTCRKMMCSGLGIEYVELEESD